MSMNEEPQNDAIIKHGDASAARVTNTGDVVAFILTVHWPMPSYQLLTGVTLSLTVAICLASPYLVLVTPVLANGCFHWVHSNGSGQAHQVTKQFCQAIGDDDTEFGAAHSFDTHRKNNRAITRF